MKIVTNTILKMKIGNSLTHLSSESNFLSSIVKVRSHLSSFGKEKKSRFLFPAFLSPSSGKLCTIRGFFVNFVCSQKSMKVRSKSSLNSSNINLLTGRHALADFLCLNGEEIRFSSLFWVESLFCTLFWTCSSQKLSSLSLSLSLLLSLQLSDEGPLFKHVAQLDKRRWLFVHAEHSISSFQLPRLFFELIKWLSM